MASLTSGGAANRPIPHPSPVSAPFWEATKQGKFLMQRCTTCNQYVWTPQMLCRTCLTDTLEWTEALGRGTVYSYVILEKSAVPAISAPYAIAVVELEEGGRFFTSLVDVDVDDVTIGMPVEVAFEDVGPVALPFFRPRRS